MLGGGYFFYNRGSYTGVGAGPAGLVLAGHFPAHVKSVCITLIVLLFTIA